MGHLDKVWLLKNDMRFKCRMQTLHQDNDILINGVSARWSFVGCFQRLVSRERHSATLNAKLTVLNRAGKYLITRCLLNKITLIGGLISWQWLQVSLFKDVFLLKSGWQAKSSAWLRIVPPNEHHQPTGCVSDLVTVIKRLEVL